MDRQIVQFGALPLDTDLLNTNRFAMTGLGMALLALLGSGTYVDGLAATPVGGNMQVQVGPGSIYTLASIDATAYGSLALDTTDQIVQQGLTFGQTTFTLTAPGTVGYSQVYLIEAQFQQTDTSPVALSYYNASNPAQPLTGAATNTYRKGICGLQVKAGAPAATGSQVAPTVDSGWTALWTVTLAYGQTAIIGANIALVSSAPYITAKLGGLIQVSAGNPNGVLAGAAATVGQAVPSLAWDIAEGTLWFCTTTGSTSTAVWSRTSIATVYAGNPNGHVAGTAAAAGGSSPSIVWDSADGAFFICTTTGTAGTAVWSPLTTLSPVNPSVTGANYAFGLSDLGQLRVRSNSGVAMADTLPTGMANGWWTEIINGDATASDTISAPSGKNLNGVLNGTIILSAGQNTSITCDALGNFWITAMPAPKLTAAQATYINASSSLNPGVYEIDTSAGPVTITLEVTPTLGDNYEFKDAYGTFAANNLILNPNGKTIQGSASNFNIDVNGLDFALEYKSGNWSLQ